MTIAEIKEKLSQESGFGSRYPARIIFVEDLDEYSALEHKCSMPACSNCSFAFAIACNNFFSNTSFGGILVKYCAT